MRQLDPSNQFSGLHHLQVEISSLLSQLIHHRLIEELVDAHILTHALQL
jgi:hypothetical protein